MTSKRWGVNNDHVASQPDSWRKDSIKIAAFTHITHGHVCVAGSKRSCQHRAVCKPLQRRLQSLGSKGYKSPARAPNLYKEGKQQMPVATHPHLADLIGAHIKNLQLRKW
jgi:hypothetical protein